MELYGLVPPGPAATSTGRGLKVAVVDTGVNFEHPHLAIPGDGVVVEWDDAEGLVVRPGQHRDRVGHGTCCAAIVHLLAPEATLYGIRVTADRPTTDVDRLARGIDHGVEVQAQVILVALGAPADHGGRLARAVVRALERGAVVVAPDPGTPVYPAACPGVVSVQAAAGVDVTRGPQGFLADGRARPMDTPGPPPPNFSGPSLSAARAAAALLRFAEGSGLRGPELVEGFSKLLEVR